MIAFLEHVATAWRIFRLLRTQFPDGADIRITPRSKETPCPAPPTA